MIETRRPVALCGENPGITLYRPGGDEIVAVAGYWRCVYSPHGAGEVALLWADPAISGLGASAPHAVYGDNLPLARHIVATFNQHFPEFKGYGFGALEPQSARIGAALRDGGALHVTCQAAERAIALTWREPLDRKLILWPGFPCGGQRYDLSTVICPCAAADIVVDGRAVQGEVRATREGAAPQSSAFLAFCETWVGPVGG